MALLPTNSDYTDKDFDSLRARLFGLVESVFPTWTNRQVANFANLLVELYAFVGDVLGFYQDNQAAESRITTATQRKNLLALVKMLDYSPRGAVAATSPVLFTLSAPVVAGRTVTLRPPGPPAPATNPVTVKNQDADDPIEFQLVSNVIIPAAGTTGVGTVKNSVKQEPEQFTSTGLPNQEVQLANTPYLDNSAEVTDDIDTFTQVENFLNSEPADTHYVVLIDANDRATVKFGDGINGIIPTGTIEVGYETGGGSGGNVEAGSLTKLDGNFVDSTGAAVEVSVTNPTASGGGEDRESDESIRVNGPESVKAVNRTVAREDYEIHARQVGGVARALMLTSNENSSVPENSGHLRIVPTASDAPPGFPSIVLKDAVLRYIRVTKPHTITFKPSVLSALYVDIGLSATIFLKPGYLPAEVRTAILDALKAYFVLYTSAGVLNPLVDFGQNLQAADGAPSGGVPLSDLYNVVRDVEGVRKIGTGTTDFLLRAYQVDEDNDAYTGGSNNAVLVLSDSYADVPIAQAEFPRLKTKILGGAYDPDVVLTIDGVVYPA